MAVSRSGLIIAAGSYERFLFGFEIDDAREGPRDSAQLKQVFCAAAHRSAVKCVASARHFLACGGADDTIRLFNMRNSKDLGSLEHHQGAVTDLDFIRDEAGLPAYLISGSEDTNLCIWKTGNWAHLQTLEGHKKPVVSLTAHPTGSLALSAATDAGIILWDLATAKRAAKMRLSDGAPERIRFTPEGDEFLAAIGKQVAVYEVGGGDAPISRLQHASRVNCFTQGKEGALLTGCEDGSLCGWDYSVGEQSFALKKAHATRIRGVALLPDRSTEDNEGGDLAWGGRHCASVSSDGVVRLWDLRMATSSDSPKPLAEMTTGARFTSLCTADWRSGERSQQAEEAASRPGSTGKVKVAGKASRDGSLKMEKPTASKSPKTMPGKVPATTLRSKTKGIPEQEVQIKEPKNIEKTPMSAKTPESKKRKTATPASSHKKRRSAVITYL